MIDDCRGTLDLGVYLNQLADKIFRIHGVLFDFALNIAYRHADHVEWLIQFVRQKNLKKQNLLITKR